MRGYEAAAVTALSVNNFLVVFLYEAGSPLVAPCSCTHPRFSLPIRFLFGIKTSM